MPPRNLQDSPDGGIVECLLFISYTSRLNVSTWMGLLAPLLPTLGAWRLRIFAMKRQDWILVVTAIAQEQGLDSAQLQKSLFLLGEELPQLVGADYYQFCPYKYGPFDPEASADWRALRDDGLVQGHDTIAATPAGQQKAFSLLEELPDEVLAYLDAVVEWVQARSFQELCDVIYAKYPAMAVNSAMKGLRSELSVPIPTLESAQEALDLEDTRIIQERKHNPTKPLREFLHAEGLL